MKLLRKLTGWQPKSESVSSFRSKISDELVLRLLQEEDAPLIFELTQQNRDYLREWLPWVDSTRSVHDSRRFIQDSLRQMANGNGFQAGVWYRNRLAGVVGFNYINHNRQQTEIGYWLGAQYQGKGLMTMSCRAMVNYAFSDVKLKRVEIRCAVGNERSCAIPKRLGFTDEGTIAQLEWLYDRYIDVIVYSMSAEDWFKQKS